MPETKFWVEMTWTDFAEASMARTIAVLPLAATEQHGPHLPLGIDTFIMEGYIETVIERLPRELPVLFLPVQNCGLSIEHTDFPGTLSIPAATLISAWTELCECVHRAGCRKLVLLNSHGGNSRCSTSSRMIFAQSLACSPCSRPGGASAPPTGSFPRGSKRMEFTRARSRHR